MRKNVYDILVIGSGMGGMCTGALLASQGYQVLVTESLPRIGGRCSTIEYKGFKCVTGVLGIELGGMVQSVLKDLDSWGEIRSAGSPHYLINGKMVRVPARGGMKHLLEAAGGKPEAVEKLMGAISKAMKWKEPSPGISLEDWVCQHSKHPGIIEIFQTLASVTLFVGVKDVQARDFFRFIKTLRGIRRFGYCPEGSIFLPEALKKRIQENGGDVWTQSPVRRILIEDGVARGARIQHHGKEISVFSSAVVSNTGPVKTARLVGRCHLDADYVNELDNTTRPAAVICLQMALDRPLFKQNHLLVTGARRLNALYQPSLVCPELAPRGKQLLIAVAKPVSLSDPSDGKKEIAGCLDDLKTLFPEVETSADLLMAGTFRGSWPGMHAMPGRDISRKTPIINLFNVGDGVKEPGYTGLPAVVKSAVLVAEEIRERVNLLRCFGHVDGARKTAAFPAQASAGTRCTDKLGFSV